MKSEKEYELINYTSLTLDEQRMILEWRNHTDVRTSMINQELISFDEHLKYLRELKDRDDKLCFLVKYINSYIGVVELSNIQNNSASIALNKNPHVKSVGDKLIEAIESIAKKRGIDTLVLSVLTGNKKAINLYKKHTFRVVSEDEKMIYMEKKL